MAGTGQNSKLAWLAVALAPSTAALVLVSLKLDGDWVLLVLAFINLICSFTAGFQLADNKAGRPAYVIVGTVLGIGFFGMNAFIGLAVGCCASGGSTGH